MSIHLGIAEPIAEPRTLLLDLLAEANAELCDALAQADNVTAAAVRRGLRKVLAATALARNEIPTLKGSHSMNKPLAVKEPVGEPLAQIPDNFGALMAVIERAATNPEVDVAKVEKLLGLAEHFEDRRAERAFNRAMTEVQKEIRPIAANMDNTQTKSRYANYEALDKALRPIYTKHGFALSFDTERAASDNEVVVLCHVSHDEGHSRTYRATLPADGKGPQGGAVMSRTHAAGAAMTYGQRYLLKLIFNIAIGEDDDGNAAGGNGPITPDKVQTLRDMIARYNVDEPKLLGFYKVAKLENLRAGDFNNAVEKINLKYAEKPKADAAKAEPAKAGAK